MEYLHALDVIASWLCHCIPISILCQATELSHEVAQRFPPASNQTHANAVLWVEPQLADWRTQLDDIAHKLNPGGYLAILISLPMARFLVERRSWRTIALGLQSSGGSKLRRALSAHSLVIRGCYGFHTQQAACWNLLASAVERLKRPDLSDRLVSAARLSYCKPNPHPWSATCALILAQLPGRSSQ
jgi:hypothetical protein